MEALQTWFLSMDSTAQTFWGCAIVASAIFLVQSIFSFIGMDGDIDFDTPDFDGDTMDAGGALSLFSVRSIVNFFMGFGWAGVTFYGHVSPVWLVYVLSIAVGLLFGSIFFVVRKYLMKLEGSGAYDIKEAVGKQANVYMRIPAERSAQGKIQISLRGSIHELPAVTDGEMLASGTHVKVTEVLGENLLLVEKV